MFHFEYYEIFKSTYFEEHLRMAASESKLLKLFIHYLMKLIESSESSVSFKTWNHSQTSQTKSQISKSAKLTNQQNHPEITKPKHKLSSQTGQTSHNPATNQPNHPQTN